MALPAEDIILFSSITVDDKAFQCTLIKSKVDRHYETVKKQHYYVPPNYDNTGLTCI